MIKIKLNNRGYAHIEMIIAFTLFFLFVFFLIMYIQPYKQNTVSDSIISNLYISFVSNASTDLTTVFFKAGGVSGDCFNIDLSSTQFSFGSNSIVKTVTGVDIGSVFSSNELLINSGEGYYYALLSDAFDPGSGCDNPVSPTDLTFGSVEHTKIISERNLQVFKQKYDVDYKNLKSELQVPSTADFAISVDGIDMNKTIPNNVEVVAKSFNEPVLYSDGRIKNKEVIVKVW